MTTSSVPAVKNALEDRFADALADAGIEASKVQVAQGEARNSKLERVEIMGAQGRSDPLDFDGERVEKYTVEVWVTAANRGKTQRAATGRAFEILGYLEDDLRADPKLALVDSSFAYMDVQSGEFEDRLWTEEEGYCAAVVWRIDVEASI